jgi:hypothetical protein
MANNTSTQLRENPGLQRMPKTEMEWVRYTNELVKWVVDLSVSGRLTSDRIMPQALLSNMGTVQNTLPVTATDAGATASVTVDAHTLSRSSGDVEYNAGSITGLAYDTRYYVYTDDEEFTGGAVTYRTTTDKADILGDLGRYFVSEVTTPEAAAADNTGAVGAGFAVLESDLTVSGLPAASTTGKGIVELAISSEVDTGTDATRAITPDALEGSNYNIVDSSPSYTLNATAVVDRTLLASASATTLNNNNVLAAIITDMKAKNVIG